LDDGKRLQEFAEKQEEEMDRARSYRGAKDKESRRGLLEAAKQAQAKDMPMDEKKEAYKRDTLGRLNERMDLGGSVSSAASASKLGDFFQYAIDKAVSLPRQKSAMLPIIGKDVEATRVSIYRESTQKKFPLLGLKLKNTSGAHLMQGPITIYEGSNYAGDAQIADLQPAEERLLSYAIDLGTEVDPVPSSENGRILSIRAVKGVVHTQVKNRQIRTYTIKNRNDAERTVLVEHPVNTAFKVVGEQPKEKASDFYRFEVKVPVGKTKTLVVTEEREDLNTYQISTAGNDDQIRWLISQPLASAEVKAGLQRALTLRLALSKTTREIGESQRQLDTLVQDQARLRANLRETPSDSDLHRRYLRRLGEQETQIETLQTSIKQMQGTEHRQRSEFQDFVAGFSAQ
jgi:hypothetical protein